jgi:DtxR family Mn-dependent transcriptional regulator
MNSWTWLLLAAVLALVVFWPRHGLLARWRQARAFLARARSEDALKHILKAEANGEPSTLLSVAGALHLGQRRTAGVLADLQRRRLLEFSGGRFQLTRAARELALHIIRAHRLWESYLAETTGLNETEWHRRAERQEHLLTPQQTRELEAALGHPTSDPHGDAIPPAGAELPAEAGQRLSDAAVGCPVTITHVEDEPTAVYEQLTAAGLRPGVRACVLDKSEHGLRVWANGTEHVIAPLPAQNIAVAPLRAVEPRDLLDEEYLSGLRPGERARVLGLSPACRGPERRRLLDLGFVPGTEVAVELVSPAGDPVAYRVRGAVVALRRHQARYIRIRRETPRRAAA